MTTVERYTPDDLAWYAETYGDTEWMVHVTGMDDCHLRVNPELGDDDPANPLLTEESAAKLAEDFNGFDAYYAQKFPGEETPGIHATVFHHGVPVDVATAEAVSGE
jgi:hypothetical protein